MEAADLSEKISLAALGLSLLGFHLLYSQLYSWEKSQFWCAERQTRKVRVLLVW